MVCRSQELLPDLPSRLRGSEEEWLQGLLKALDSAGCRAQGSREELEHRYVTVAWWDDLLPSKFFYNYDYIT